jgi:hypothetical protein
VPETEWDLPKLLAPVDPTAFFRDTWRMRSRRRGAGGGTVGGVRGHGRTSCDWNKDAERVVYPRTEKGERRTAQIGTIRDCA